MSIAVDISDTISSLSNGIGSRNSFPIQSTNKRFQDILKFLRQALFIRRLKLLKVFMASVLAIFLLAIVLFKSRTTSSSNSNFERYYEVDKNGIGINFKDRIANAEDLTNKENVIHSDIQGNHIIQIIGKPSYPNNLSYSLTINDFAQMRINLMQARIRDATKHSWDNYRKYAWGYDMLKPRSREPDHWFYLGLTIVDSADTLAIMGLTNEAKAAIDWIENDLNFESKNENSNCFELTIRILGGMLSMYHLTSREKLKAQATMMGDILLNCYDTNSKVIPNSDIDLNTRRSHPPPWNPHSSLSEVASLQLEFRYLTQMTNNPIYEQTTFRTSEHIHNLTLGRTNKLLPKYISPSSGQFDDSIITLGARTDSYYEYLLKQYLQTGIKWLEDDYLDAVDEMAIKLFRHTDGEKNYTYIAEMQVYQNPNGTEDIKYYNRMDHLICFLPGTLALGYYKLSPEASEYRLKYNLNTPINRLNPRYNGHLDLAQRLARTCYHMYKDMGTGLAPEIATFVHSQPEEPLSQNQPEIQAQSSSAHNILRPEFVESLFYLYHITGLENYRKQAGEIFEAFEKYSRIPSGYSPISDVRQKPESDADIEAVLHRHAPDRMESFWISETLKYLYLIFCDDKKIVGTLLNNYVFNTEAHMLPIV